MKDFKAFLMRGNVVDMAVGIVIGAAFGGIVASLVKDVIMPPVGLALGKLDFSNMTLLLRGGTPPGPYASVAAAQAAGAVTVNYGLFINTLINFVILAAVIFFFVVRPIARMQASKNVAPSASVTKDCPFCLSRVPSAATRCPNCTSELKASQSGN